MSLELSLLGADFVAEVRGVDFTRKVAPEVIAQITAILDQYGVAVFRETGLDDQRHVNFSRQFGELELAPKLFGAQRARFSHPELFDAGNVDRDGQILVDERRRLYNKGNALWHTDSSFNPRRAAYSLLLAHRVPPVGGDTEFANMRAAYAALPESTKSAIDGLIAQHWLWHSRLLAGYPAPTENEKLAKPPSQHRLVQYHAGAGSKTLYLAAHASHIVGWPEANGAELIRELMEFATQPRFTCAVRWHQAGDLVIWDNRSTMHRATAFEDKVYPRDMRRTTVYDSLG